ncbi:MAG: hypothetical protein D8M59_02450 [Planctomycetes bacterium]|nr:hypothetical protein [Planctomycetota bacterium]
MVNKTAALVGGSLLGGLVLLLVLAQLGPKSAPGNTEEPTIDEGLRGLMGTGSPDGEGSDPILMHPDHGMVDPGDVSRLASGRAVIQFEGEDGRIEQRYTYEHLEPAARGWHTITSPIAYFYASDTELIVLRSDTARALLVQNKPQAGTLEGNVEISLYEVANARDIESVEDLDPTIVCRTSVVNFDDNLNELHAPERVTGESQDWAFAGTGLSLVYSSMDDLIQTLRFEQREYILLRAKQQASNDATDSPPAVVRDPVGSDPPDSANAVASGGLPTSDSGQEITPVEHPDRESLASSIFYQLVLSGEVIIERQISKDERLTIAGTRLTADLAVQEQSLGNLLAGAVGRPSDLPHLLSSMAGVPQWSVGATGARTRAVGMEQDRRTVPWAAVAMSSLISTLDSGWAIIPTAVSRYAAPVQSAQPPTTSPPEMSDGDILITGKGPLSIRRLTKVPTPLQEAGDVWAVMDGQPVTVTLPDGAVSAGQLDYSRSNARLRFSPSSRYELNVKVGELGELMSSTARLVVLLPDDGRENATALVEGPGRFESESDLIVPSGDGPNWKSGSQPAGESLATQEETNVMPEVFRISWLDGLELRFDLEEAARGAGTVTQDGQLRSAVFTGRVRADHTGGLVLEAEELTATFEKPDKQVALRPGDGRSALGSTDVALKTVKATRDVKARSPDGSLETDDLLLTMRATPDGVPVPESAEASGHVSVTDLENRLTANYLFVHFADRVATDDSADQETGEGTGRSASVLSGQQLGQDVDHVIATGSLLLEMPDDRMALADQLEAFPLENRAVLTGQRVQLSQNMAQVTAGEVWLLEEVDEDGALVRLVRIPGPGVGTYVEPAQPLTPGSERVIDKDEQLRLIEKRMGASRHLPGTGQAAADGSSDDGLDDDDGDDVRLVRVEWDENAEYREVASEGAELTLLGNVKAEYSPRAAEYNTIEAQRLEFELSNPLELGDQGTERRLRTMTAIGNDEHPALLQGGRYTDGTRGVPILLVSIWSQIVEYDDVIEKLETSGDGSMLVVDYRSEDEPIAGSEDDPWLQSGRKPMIDLTGRGETRFDWTGSLVLDGGRGKLGLQDDVIVRHRPLDERRVMRLACQQLDAELSSAASVGTDPMQLAGGESMSLALARASHGVTIHAMDRIVSAASMQYDGRRKVIDLDSDDTQLVSVVEQGSAFPAEMTSCRWDLVSDTIEVTEGRPIRVPTN